MPGFRFKLQPLLDYRAAAEGAARRALLDGQAAANREAAVLASPQADFTRFAAPLRDPGRPIQ